MLEIAEAKEATLREAKQLFEVNKVKAKESQSKINQSVAKKEAKREFKSEAGKGQSWCFHCGESEYHDFKTCKFKRYTCAFCKKKGHIIKACRSKLSKNHYFEEKEAEQPDFFNINICNLGSRQNYVKPICFRMLVNKKPLVVEVD